MPVKRKGNRAKRSDDAADELGSIKRLLVLQLITSGVKAKDIAAALGIHQSAVSRLVPSRKVKKRAPSS
jgi:predicted transcriptional regulator